jgi:hypothetical protein
MASLLEIDSHLVGLAFGAAGIVGQEVVNG